jgi:hypothetical protein
MVHIPRSKVFSDSPNRFSPDFYCFVSRLSAIERRYTLVSAGDSITSARDSDIPMYFKGGKSLNLYEPQFIR